MGLDYLDDMYKLASAILLGIVGFILRSEKSKSKTTEERMVSMTEQVAELQQSAYRTTNCLNDLVMRIEGLEYKFKSLNRRLNKDE